jgi:hypothetical protein
MQFFRTLGAIVDTVREVVEDTEFTQYDANGNIITQEGQPKSDHVTEDGNHDEMLPLDCDWF